MVKNSWFICEAPNLMFRPRQRPFVTTRWMHSKLQLGHSHSYYPTIYINQLRECM